jgi:manganese efflux pump family protein
VASLPGARWRDYAVTMVVTGVVLAGAVAGCSSPPAATGDAAASCYQFAASAIQHHVTVTGVPPACRGLSQVEVNVAVSRALRAAASGVRGKVRQRQVIARDSRYVAGLIRVIPASSPPAVAASAPPPGQPAVVAPSSRPPSRAALGLAALIAWLVTVGLGLSMMARWITRTRRAGRERGPAPRPQPRPGRGPVLNFAHLGLALTGLLIWISYLITGVTGLAWAACGLLLAVASLGMALVFLALAVSDAATRSGDDPPPAGRPPLPLIAAHITLACVTILLATLAAIGSG